MHFLIKAGVHYRARTRLGRVAEAKFISAFFPRQTRKSVRIIVSWDITTNLYVLTADIPGNVLGINLEGRKTCSERNLSRICGEVAELMRIY